MFVSFFAGSLHKVINGTVGWKLLNTYCWSFLWPKHWYFEIKKTTTTNKQNNYSFTSAFTQTFLGRNIFCPGSQDFLLVPLVLFRCEQLTRNFSGS